MSDVPVTPVQSVPPSQSANADDRVGGVAAPTLVQSIALTPPSSATPQVPSGSKEKGAVAVSETVPLIEVSTGASALEKEPIPPEVEAWMDKVGQEAAEVKLETLPSVQVPLPPPTQGFSSQPQFVLPLGEQEMQMGLHASVNDSIRWLATWARRLIKQLQGQVAFRSS